MSDLIRRNSKQRQMILDAVRAADNHPTAEDIYNTVRRQVPNVSLGTVYRNLNLLSQMGEIQKLELGCENDRFDRTCTPHAHFICSRCGSVTDLTPSIQAGAEQLVAKGCQAVVKQVMVTAYGLCEQCLDSDQ